MTNLNAIPTKAETRRAVWIWTSVIVGLLCLQLGMCIAGVILATRSAPAVEANYYDKSGHWDEQQAAERASKALGWTAAITCGDAMTTDGSRALIVTLTDAGQAPIAGATVQVDYFFHAHGQQHYSVKLMMGEPGKYVASTPLPYAGLCEFRITIQRGKQAFVHTSRQEVAKASGQ